MKTKQTLKGILSANAAVLGIFGIKLFLQSQFWISHSFSIKPLFTNGNIKIHEGIIGIFKQRNRTTKLE